MDRDRQALTIIMHLRKHTLLRGMLIVLALTFTGQTFATGYTTTYYYNDAKNRTIITDPNGHQTLYEYSGFGEPDDGYLINVLQQATFAGTPPNTSSPWGRVTQIGRDVAGHILHIAQINVRTNKSLTRTYHYDNHWFLTSEV